MFDLSASLWGITQKRWNCQPKMMILPNKSSVRSAKGLYL